MYAENQWLHGIEPRLRSFDALRSVYYCAMLKSYKRFTISQPVYIGLIMMSFPPPRSNPISIELNARETEKFLAPVKALPIGHPHAPIAVGWRERQDLNLRALRPPAFKAGAIDQLCHVHTWPKVGLEPTTYRLQGDCAAITLFRHTARLQSHRGKVHPCKTGGHPRPSHAGSEAWLIAMRKECQ